MFTGLHIIPYDLTEKIIFANSDKSDRLYRIGRGEFVMRRLVSRVIIWHRDNATPNLRTRMGLDCSGMVHGVLK